MHRRLTARVWLVAALAALTIAAGPAMAQISSATKINGTAGSAGNLKRTITDIPARPNSLAQSPFELLQVTSTEINVPIANGDSPNTIGTNLRNTINADGTLQSLGYSSVFTTPSGTANPSRPKMARQVGTFNVVDVITGASGVSRADSPYTVEDAPALSPVGLGFLFGALPALAFWRRRGRKDD